MNKAAHLGRLAGSISIATAYGTGNRAVASRVIIARAERLASREVEIEVHWVSSHVVFNGNSPTDRTTKAAAGNTGVRRCTEQFASLTDINRTITEKKGKENKHWVKAKHEARQHVLRPRYNPNLDTQELRKVALYKKVYIARVYYQLKAGHAVTVIYHKLKGRTESDRC